MTNDLNLYHYRRAPRKDIKLNRPAVKPVCLMIIHDTKSVLWTPDDAGCKTGYRIKANQAHVLGVQKFSVHGVIFDTAECQSYFYLIGTPTVPYTTLLVWVCTIYVLQCIIYVATYS